MGGHSLAFVDVMEALDAAYTLVWVDHGDQLTPDQLDMLATGDFEELWDSVDDWADTVRSAAVTEVLAEVLADLDYDESDLTEEELLDIHMTIFERDDSAPLRELVDASGFVACRVFLDADNIGGQVVEIDEVYDLLRQSGLDIEVSDHNSAVIGEVLSESVPEFTYLWPMVLFEARASALYEIVEGPVVVVDPYLFFGNIYAGSGWVGEDPLHATFTVDRQAIRSDRAAPGPSWTERIAQTYSGTYQCEIRRGESPCPEQ